MPRIAVNVDDQDVFVCFSRLDVLWTLRRTVRLAREQVAAVEVGPAPARHGWRAPGTYWPGVIAAGTWRDRGGKELWDVRTGERVLVIDCTDDAPFRRVVLEVVDPDAVAARLMPAANPPRSRRATPPGSQLQGGPLYDRPPASWQ